ncbi:MAG: multiheme c-type cytochrome, partial [Planctomycetaceae bacterium]
MSATQTAVVRQGGRLKYVPAVGPRLKILLYVVFALLALLGANSLYLASITAFDALGGYTLENWFYQYMILGHLVLGILFLGPFLTFALIHLFTARKRKNRRAVRAGFVLFLTSLVVLISGLLLMRIGAFDLKQPLARATVYWLHVLSPLVAGWLYWLHRLAGQKIRYRLGLIYLALVGAAVGGMVAVHSQDPRNWNVVGPQEGVKYFEPSLARTASGNFIPAKALTNEQYCIRCHQDIYGDWFHSAHHFSSFNNPAYLASVRETREVALKRDGNVKASRWCAGCHDPVPFFSGAFDDPNFDDVNHPTAQAGITCSVCHSITNVNSTRGNADYTIEEPLHYPFAYSDDPVLQWINNQLVKAKPSFHKKTFLKDFHKSAEFCSTCHKVHLPFAVTHYKEFLRGQNHHDSYWLSGVSGYGARSFYYPPVAKKNCSECHMPLVASDDFGAKHNDDSGRLTVHDHLFVGANTGVAHFNGSEETFEAHRKFLEGCARVDIFGVREGGTISGELHAPIRPEVPTLTPGESYLLETVIRTLTLGHHFTQGTADSNEIWLDVTVTSGEGENEKIIGRSGAMNENHEVDPWSHFVNMFLLDKDGNRIDRRNPQDIFVPLYNHQIPPGAGQTVHYSLTLPDDLDAPVTVEVKLQYRKFDSAYMDFVTKSAKPGDDPIRGHERGEPYVNDLPVVTIATDRVTFPVEGAADAGLVNNPPRDIPEWQRWNDYGIGLFLKGKAELRQAAEAFEQVEKLGRYDGPLNLVRVLHREGRLDEAVAAMARAAEHDDPAAPPWTMAWLSGLINREQGHLDEAEQNFRSTLSMRVPERGFDFSKDYEVILLLGQTMFDRARQMRGEDDKAQRIALLQEAVDTFESVIEPGRVTEWALDSENVTAHYNLALLHAALASDVEDGEARKRHEA